MEEYFNLALRFVTEFQAWNPPKLVLAIVAGFSGLSAWVMTRYITAAPMFVAPICFMILAVSALFANFAARNHVMMGTTEIQKILLYTVVAQALACLVLLASFRSSLRSRR
jgi:hypothetical protein